MLVSQLEINMGPIRTLHPLARAWLLDGPLSGDLDAYLALLERGRYAEAASRSICARWRTSPIG